MRSPPTPPPLPEPPWPSSLNTLPMVFCRLPLPPAPSSWSISLLASIIANLPFGVQEMAAPCDVIKAGRLPVRAPLPAIDGDHGAVDPAGTRRDEERRDIGDRLGGGKPPQRKLAGDEPVIPFRVG